MNFEISFNTIKNKFSIINTSNIVHLLQICEQKIVNIYDNIEKIENNTGIMIGNLYINTNISLYLFVFDYHVIIVDENELNLFFNQIVSNNQYFFINSETEKEIKAKINDKIYNSIENITDEQQINQNIISKNIEEIILDCIIKKSLIRSSNRRIERNKNVINTSIKYKYEDFIKIKNMGEIVDLYFNIIDQFLYVLKKFDINNKKQQKQYEHEITFYRMIKNESPFICKYYGQIETEFSKIIILEYIEGDTLLKFIKKNRNQLSTILKIQIIIDLLLGVEFIHSKNIIIRDLKIDNIIIDSNKNAILIDFDQTSLIQANENDFLKNITVCIGSDYFAAPEQYSSSKYSQKADIYSLGMCIHYIITEIEYNFNIYDILQKIQTVESNNILSFEEIPKCAFVYKDIEPIYKHCLDFLPESRPDAIKILYSFLLYMHYLIVNDHETKNTSLLSLNPNDTKSQDHHRSIYYDGINFDKYIYYLTILANQGHSNAQYRLGVTYYDGKYLVRDINKSIYYLTLSANQNNFNSQYLLGVIYYNGRYVARDINKSIYYLTLSANQNNLNSQYLLGVIYYNGKDVARDINKSIYYLTLSANQNNFNSQYLLGVIYYNGRYVARDIYKSIYYLTLSANHNNSDAQYLLGEIYSEGKYVVIDINKSIYYLTLSANQNNSEAQFLLGFIYYKGEYILRDINKSIYYLTLSANQNNSSAQLNLGFIYYKGEYISRDINKSVYYLIRSANQYNSYALFLLGIIYGSDDYGLMDINKSIHYLKLSSDLNNQCSQYYLGIIYYNDEAVPRDISKSIHYLTLSANQNFSMAQNALGIIYYSGEYVKKDINKSIYYFKGASCFYNNESKNNLGVIYKNGYGVKKNIYNAIEYFEESIRQKNDLFSTYNLIRIYYFGIDIERNIEKMKHIIENFKDSKFNAINLFLYYIYKYGDDSLKDEEKSNYYESLIYDELKIKNIKRIILCEFDSLTCKLIFHQRLQEFLKSYDLEYVSNKSFEDDFVFYMSKGIFQEQAYYKTNNKTITKNINNEFYKGFYEQ